MLPNNNNYQQSFHEQQTNPNSNNNDNPSNNNSNRFGVRNFRVNARVRQKRGRGMAFPKINYSINYKINPGLIKTTSISTSLSAEEKCNNKIIPKNDLKGDDDDINTNSDIKKDISKQKNEDIPKPRATKRLKLMNELYKDNDSESGSTTISEYECRAINKY